MNLQHHVLHGMFHAVQSKTLIVTNFITMHHVLAIIHIIKTDYAKSVVHSLTCTRHEHVARR